MTDINEYGIKPIKFEVVYDNEYGQIDDYIEYTLEEGGTHTQEGFIDFIVEG